MKILYLINIEPEETLAQIMEAHEAAHDVTKIDIRTDKDYNKIVEQIEASNRIICV